MIPPASTEPLQELTLLIHICIPERVDSEQTEKFIRDHIFIPGWSGAFASNYIKVDQFQFIYESHCDKCDHWDICDGCPYIDERARAPVQQAPEPCEIEGDPCLCMGSPCSRMKEHDAALIAQAREEGAKAERDKIYKRLESLAYQDFEEGCKIPVVDWPDIDCLFAELRSSNQKQEPPIDIRHCPKGFGWSCYVCSEKQTCENLKQEPE